MTDKDTEVKTINTEAEDEETRPAEVYAETAEEQAPDLDEEQIKAAALAYAKYLRDMGLEPGDATFADPEELGVDLEEKKPDEDPEEPENPEKTEEPAEAEPEKAEEPTEQEPQKEEKAAS